MHVLRLTPHFYWPQLAKSSWPVKYDAIGGMQSQIWRLTEALDDLGLHQTVLTLKIPGTPMPWHMSERTQVWGVRVPVFPFRSRIRGMVDLNLSWALGVIKKVRSENIRPDIVHIHCSGVYLPPLIGHLISRLTQAPLVTTIHCSILGTYHPMSMLDRVTQPMARQVERQAIRASARTITLTPKSIDLLQKETGVDTSRFAVLPDIIDAEAFAARANDDAVETLRQRWRIPSDRRIVGYVGRIAREKGWPILLDIAEKLKDEPIHWLICGDGNERDLFERDIRSRGITHLFTVTGYVPNEEVPNAMKLMDLMVMASLHEEFGSVMLEAMAVKLPIIAFGTGGVSSVLENGALGWLVPQRTPEAFAQSILDALNDREKLAQKAEQAYRVVQRKYGLAAVAQTTMDMYRAVLAEATEPRSQAAEAFTLR